jgi:hypothetical protein
MRKYIIGICGGSFGEKGVGKTTASDALVGILGFKRVSTMDVIKEVAKASGMENYSCLEAIDFVCRSGRKINENFWLNLATKVMDGHDKLVLDDVWFGNEAKFIRDNGGIVVMIKRPGVTVDDLLEFRPDITIDNSFDTVAGLKDAIVSVVTRHYKDLIPIKTV